MATAQSYAGEPPGSREAFLRDFESFDAVPVCRQLIADGLTPLAAFRRLDDGQFACLFESVTGGDRVGRYSFLAAGPYKLLQAWNRRVVVRTGRAEAQWDSDNPVADLRRELAAVRVAERPGLPPFAGGAVGYVGYDAVRYVERLPDPPPDDRDLPDLCFAFFDRVVVFDHVTRTMSVIVLAWRARHASAELAWQQAHEAIDATIRLLEQPDPGLRIEPVGIAEGGARTELPADVRSNVTAEEFRSMVREAVEYIRAGDIFQVVLSQRLETGLDCDPLEVYRTLRVLNPSPFMFFLRTPAATLVGSSPEIMCRVTGRTVTVRPLAGTRRRGADLAEDQRLEAELLADEKERAEHVMLVDLGRNDVGKIAEYGSVQLPEVMVVERYSHVMHLSSTVTGRLRSGLDAFDALMSCLPAGTVSGAPKVRAMQIIDGLEKVRRGPYAGAVGYFDHAGNMDTCITLRTMVARDGVAWVQAGAGIVADSDPDLEYAETLGKAWGLLRAIRNTRERLARPRDIAT